MDDSTLDRFLQEGEQMVGAAILEALSCFFRRFVVLSQAEADISAVWAVHTHVAEAAAATPFIVISSPEPEAGKTRWLETAEFVVRKPLRASSLSAAVLYTKVQEEQPTLLLDEMDAVFGPKAKNENEELRALLNAGNRRGSKAYRCAWEGKQRRTESFDVFCPRALAGLGELPETIETRSIQIRLKRRKEGESVERLGPREMRRVEPEARALGEQIEAWTASNIERLREADPDFPPGLRDRQEEFSQPLLAIADLAHGAWPERVRRALVEVLIQARTESRGERLLRDCRRIFDSREADRIHSTDLCEALAEIEDAPWPEANKGKPITPRGLSRLLEGFKIRPQQLWIDGTNRNGYERFLFEDAWSRYVPASPCETRLGTLETLAGEDIKDSSRRSDGPETPERTASLGKLEDLDTPSGRVRKAAGHADEDLGFP
jgi:Protein of unknown function (DUF3631)